MNMKLLDKWMIDGWMDRLNGWVDGQQDRQMNGLMDGWMDGRISTRSPHQSLTKQKEEQSQIHKDLRAVPKKLET